MASSPKFSDLKSKSDIDLVSLALKDKEAFWHLMKRYEQRLFRYILRISDFSREEAEDVLQEVFISLYRNLHSFDPLLPFSSWAYRIAHNKTVSRWRRKKSRPQTIELESNEARKLSSLIDLKQEVDDKLLAGQVAKVIKELPDKYREILVLRFFENRSYQEISDILKKPPGTVATLIRTAKQSFRGIWKNIFSGSPQQTDQF